MRNFILGGIAMFVGLVVVAALVVGFCQHMDMQQSIRYTANRISDKLDATSDRLRRMDDKLDAMAQEQARADAKRGEDLLRAMYRDPAKR